MSRIRRLALAFCGLLSYKDAFIPSFAAATYIFIGMRNHLCKHILQLVDVWFLDEPPPFVLDHPPLHVEIEVNLGVEGVARVFKALEREELVISFGGSAIRFDLLLVFGLLRDSDALTHVVHEARVLLD